MEERRMRNMSGRMLLLIVLVLAAALPALWLLSEAAFAEEEGEGPVLLDVSVGENGTVDGHENDYIEKIDSGEDVTLTLEANDGYVIDEVQVNEEPLESSDLEGITGEPYAELDLDSPDSDLQVAVSFTEGEASVDAAGEDGDTSEDAQADGAVDGEDEASPAGSEDPEAGDSEAGRDAGDTDTDAGDAETGDDADAAGTDEEAEADASEDPADGTDDVSDDGEEDDVTSAGESPRTGDPFPLTVLLILAASLTMIGIVICRTLQLRRREG